MKIAMIVATLFAATLAAQQNAAFAEVAEVKIENYKFQPEKVTVKVGTTVKWTNNEKRASHSIWFKAERIPESERMFSGDSWERSFDKPGTYPYTCGPHPEMQGVVEVTP
ncbi:MAG TPA: cupredoxin domain-containing protein [Burkholderiales bacterium]|nr:cupredoxin domain-containing protein [Burkholderiales bacterium]